jgi:hypothetical protein
MLRGKIPFPLVPAINRETAGRQQQQNLDPPPGTGYDRTVLGKVLAVRY